MMSLWAAPRPASSRPSQRRFQGHIPARFFSLVFGKVVPNSMIAIIIIITIIITT